MPIKAFLNSLQSVKEADVSVVYISGSCIDGVYMLNPHAWSNMACCYFYCNDVASAEIKLLLLKNFGSGSIHGQRPIRIPNPT